MADTEPSRKKRVSERQITKDDLEEDDNEGDSTQVPSGTFAKASEDVLAQRKIVRARRPQPGGGSTAAAASPFANVKLTAPAVPAPKPALYESPPGKANIPEKEGDEVESKAEKSGEANGSTAGNEGEKAEEKEGQTAAQGTGANEEGKTAEAAPSASDQEKLTGKKPQTFGGFGAFAQQGGLSSPFGASAAQGTSSPFGGFNFGSGSAPAFGGSAFPSLSSVFGKAKDSGAPVQLFQSGTSVGTAGTEGASSPAITPVVTLPEQAIETGEESEESVHTIDASLFEFAEGSWRERGKGELRVNVAKGVDRPARLVMRSKGNLRLLLNASLFPDMKLSKMDGRGVTFACMNCVGTDEKKETKLGTFAVRLKDPAAAADFMDVITKYKSRGSSSVAKTDEEAPQEGAGEGAGVGVQEETGSADPP